MDLEAVVGKESSFFSLGSKLRKYALALSLLAFGYSCGSNQDKEEPTLSACASDTECKGSRICREGKCVDPTNSETYSDAGNHSVTDGESFDGNNHYATDGGSSGNNQPRADAGSSGNNQPSCTSRTTKICYENDVYWQDSCGNLEGLFDDCDSDQYCNDAQCVNEEPQCSSHASRACHNGDVYWLDSCGNLESIFDDCSNNESCSNATCVTQEPQCTSHADKICDNGDVYWRNSCGELESVFQRCGEDQECEGNTCIDRGPDCSIYSSEYYVLDGKCCTNGNQEWKLCVVSSISAPSGRGWPEGIAWDGQYLWNITDGNRVNKLTTSGQVVSSFQTNDISSMGMAFDGQYLWITNTASQISKYTTSGQLIDTFDLPSESSTSKDLTWDGQSFWNVDMVGGQIHKLNNTGGLLATLNAPADNPYGIAWDGTHLWNTDPGTDRIYRLSTTGQVVNSFSAPGTGPMCLTRGSGAYFWLVNASISGTMRIGIYQLEVLR